MSKRNMLLGLAAGKVGDLVFYRDGGEQRTRTRVIPKNPRSPMQMAQRVKIANVSAFYRLFTSIIRDSFTNLPSNQSGYNAFAKQAIAVSPFVTREAALRGSVIPAPYAVSKGTLPSLEFAITTMGQRSVLAATLLGVTPDMTTIAEASAALIEADPNFQQGDKVVFMAAAFTRNPGIDAVESYTATPVVSVFTVDVANGDTLEDAGFSPVEDGLTMDASELGEVAVFAAIHVRDDAAMGLQTSSANVVLSPTASTIYNASRTDEALNLAIESYGVGATSILRD